MVSSIEKISMMINTLKQTLRNFQFKKPTKSQYILGFAVVVLLLAGVKRLFAIGEGSESIAEAEMVAPQVSVDHSTVYVGESPYYHVDKLRSSIPYLVPRAAVLLQDIGQAFYDSLYAKGVPMNQLIVTSVLRTMDDVKKLQRHNGNATDNSCHLYGTTFDICYNRYHPVAQAVRNDTLKWVLSEVLRDMRESQRCYIKYEVKQGCFHMTVR